MVLNRVIGLIAVVALFSSTAHAATAEELAKRIFERITGVPFHLNHHTGAMSFSGKSHAQTRQEMINLINSGDVAGAARLVFEDQSWDAWSQGSAIDELSKIITHVDRGDIEDPDRDFNTVMSYVYYYADKDFRGILAGGGEPADVRIQLNRDAFYRGFPRSGKSVYEAIQNGDGMPNRTAPDECIPYRPDCQYQVQRFWPWELKSSYWTGAPIPPGGTIPENMQPNPSFDEYRNYSRWHLRGLGFAGVSGAPENLERQSPQSTFHQGGAAAITSYDFGKRYLSAGTNRRAIKGVLKNYLCIDLGEGAFDLTLTDLYVGRDVKRDPSGDPAIYQNTCRGCHSIIDSLRPAYAYYDYDTDDGYGVQRSFVVQEKMNKNATNNNPPVGYQVPNDRFYVTIPQGSPSTRNTFGLRNANRQRYTSVIQGNGPAELGNILANSEAFSSCMVRRAFKILCGRDFNFVAEGGLFANLIDDFENGRNGVVDNVDDYQLTHLFEKVVSNPVCSGTPGA